MPSSHDELIDLIEISGPPDDDLVDLIERAFLEGQIDGLKADLDYLWLQANNADFRSKCYPSCYPKRKRAH